VRVSFVPNVEGDDANPKTDLNALVWSTLNSLSGDEALESTLKLLSLDSIHESDTSSVVKGFLPATRMHMKLLRVYCQRVLKLSQSANAIIVNGKVLGPLNVGEIFTVDDFNLLEKFNNHQYGDKIRKALKESFKTEGEDAQVHR
jgi:UDP-glucose:glycoprotein glucosyltransferase